MPLVFSEEAVKRLPAPIVEKLRSMITRIRRVLWWRGLWLTFAATVAALLVVMAVDGAFDLESVPVRSALSLAGLCFVIGVTWRHLVRPLSRSVSLAAVARAVEFHHPEMHERISTAVELLGSDDPASLRGSEELLGEVVKSAVMDVAGVSPETEFSNAPARWPKRLAVAALAALVLVLAIWPFHGGMLIARALLPFANIGSASSFDLRVITQDATVAEGEPLSILVAATGRAARRVELHRGTDSASSTERLLPETSTQVEKGETAFALHIPAVADGFRYHVTSGRARSREFTITVLKRPDITGLSVTYTPPAYTGLPPRTDPESTGDLVALSGTRIEVTARLSRPAVSAHLQYDQTENTGPPVSVGTDADGKTPVARWAVTLEAGTDYRWTLQPKGDRDVLGKPHAGVLRSTEDLAPAVVIDSPLDRELNLRPNDVLPIIYTAADDYGFSAVDLMVKLDGRGGPMVTVPLPARDPSEAQTWHGTGTLELSKLALIGVHEVRVSVRVSDSLPPTLQGPQRAQSEEVLIHLNWGAQSFAGQTVNKQEEQIRKELEQIKNDLWDERGKADEKTWQLRKPDQMRAEQLQQLEKLTERAAQSAEKLSATAARMEKSAYAERAEAVEHAAKKMVQPAAESLQQIPQSDSPQERSASAAQARDQLQAAAKSIDEVLAALHKDQEQAQEASELTTLAEQQQQLADQARAESPGSETAQQPASNPQAPLPPPPPSAVPAPQSEAASPPLTPEQQAQSLQKWQEQQEYVAREAGNYANQFQKQSPPDKQSDLQKLAAQAETLAAQARQLAQKQDSVEQKTAESAQSPAIAAEAAQRQADVAAEAQQLAGAVEEFSQQAGGTLQQNGTATTNAEEAAQALAHASETGREAVSALSREAAEPAKSERSEQSDQSDQSEQSEQSDESDAAGSAAQQAAAQTGQSLDTAAAALQESAQALAHQSEGIATASQALASATQETSQAATAGQQAREAGQKAGQQAAQQAAQNGQNPQQAQQQAANAAQDQALAQNAAGPAQQAANNLALAAATAQSAMGIPKESLTSQNMGQHGSPKPGDGQSGQSQSAQNQQKSTQPGRNPADKAGLQTTKEYALPPELAKLGMTIDDWSRIRGLVQSGSDAAAGDRVPAEYRELVKGYFRALSAGTSVPR